MTTPTSGQVQALLSETIEIRQRLDSLFGVQEEVLRTLQDNNRILCELRDGASRRRTGW